MKGAVELYVSHPIVDLSSCNDSEEHGSYTACSSGSSISAYFRRGSLDRVRPRFSLRLASLRGRSGFILHDYPGACDNTGFYVLHTRMYEMSQIVISDGNGGGSDG
ncbi:uncharacterized protein LOC119984600 [Tripterygium wilfordii]|uniref:uncharacterized protein LOC119984600 n=1 Tax=Tripterygium wilfordii TaxID=458696 RepID=UPI0018F85348|nr:uncharacterized protein LOC119984600 [Tripterygium wilfordii]XP_038684548.1 uncharacterized protein LOC119984600 [Tripterygium wilfordii]XP_038684550.1 uncharacterized protein LOC119984600 [Tripterygium wilfordii]